MNLGKVIFELSFIVDVDDAKMIERAEKAIKESFEQIAKEGSIENCIVTNCCPQQVEGGRVVDLTEDLLGEYLSTKKTRNKKDDDWKG